VHFQDVMATIYQRLGIDVGTAQVVDLAGRPHYLVEEEYRPLRELV